MKRILSQLLFLVYLSLLSLSFSTLQAQTVGTYYTNNNIGFEAITHMPNGDIYTVDFYAGTVYRLDVNDSLTLIASGLGNIAGGGADGAGNFYFSAFSQGRVYKVNSDDTYSQFATGLSTPVGLQLSPDSSFFYVIEFTPSRIRKIDLSTGMVSSFVSGNGLNGPDGMALAPNGDLIAANYNNNQLTRIQPDGTMSNFGSHPAFGNMGYITRAGAYYYVPSISGNSIARFDSAGNAELFAGTGVAGYVDGMALDAQFNDPNGITSNLAGDSLWITEQGRIRYVTDLENMGTAIELSNEASDFQVYPSPFLQEVQLQYLPTQASQVKLELIDMNGKVLFTLNKQLLPNQTWDQILQLPELAEGAYVLQIWENGQLRGIRKLIKEASW